MSLSLSNVTKNLLDTLAKAHELDISSSRWEGWRDAVLRAAETELRFVEPKRQELWSVVYQYSSSRYTRNSQNGAFSRSRRRKSPRTLRFASCLRFPLGGSRARTASSPGSRSLPSRCWLTWWMSRLRAATPSSLRGSKNSACREKRSRRRWCTPSSRSASPKTRSAYSTATSLVPIF